MKKRDSEKRKRSLMLRFRATPEEKAMFLRAAAIAERESISDFFRIAVKREAQRLLRSESTA